MAVFIEDNSACHKAMTVMSYLSQHNAEIMDWQAQIPFLNRIEIFGNIAIDSDE